MSVQRQIEQQRIRERADLELSRIVSLSDLTERERLERIEHAEEDDESSE